MNDRKVILFIAASLDGYIAGPNDNLDFLGVVEKDGEDYGYSEFINTVDTVILGRRTYDWVMSKVTEFPHADKNTFVITHTPKPSTGRTQFYTGDITELLLRLKNEPGKNIFIDGGAELVNILLKGRQMDELVISVIPVLVGDGIRLFKDGRPEQQLELISSRQFDKGLVQLKYKVGSDKAI